MSLDVVLSEYDMQGELGPAEKNVYERNVTHNLVPMAKEAGLYEFIWRPDNFTYARELVEPLVKGLRLLKENPDRFKKFNHSGGYGKYEEFVEFVEDYLQACKKYPDALVYAYG